MKHNMKILILTPLKDAEAYLPIYFKNLYHLTCPHQNISLGFLESDSQDRTYAILQARLAELNREFRQVRLWQRDFGFKLPPGMPQWAGQIQYERRSVLARSRNHLLFNALDDEDWVLWLDVDVVDYPADIIERLLATGKEIVHPHCVREYHGPSYDRNAWRNRGRLHLDDLRSEGDLVELHAVGGTMLLVKADVHRDGLIFPPFLYGRRSKRMRRTNFFFAHFRDLYTDWRRISRALYNGTYRGEMETEGLGLMAHDMGYTCWGMPNLEVKHR